MKNQITFALVLTSANALAAPIHPADEYDVKSAARFQVTQEYVKAGTPKQSGAGYEVPVEVNGLKCTVLVLPYTPSSIEPPVRWKANPPKCPR